MLNLCKKYVEKEIFSARARDPRFQSNWIRYLQEKGNFPEYLVSGHTKLAYFHVNNEKNYTLLKSDDIFNISIFQQHQQLIWATDTLECNILCYNYGGYGLSEDPNFYDAPLSENSLYSDAQSMYDYLINDKKLKSNQIILYGTEYGCAPTLELAVNNQNVAGIILTSCYESLLMSRRVQDNENTYTNLSKLMSKNKWLRNRIDIFKNEDKISLLRNDIPVLIIHEEISKFGSDHEFSSNFDLKYNELLYQKWRNINPFVFESYIVDHRDYTIFERQERSQQKDDHIIKFIQFIKDVQNGAFK